MLRKSHEEFKTGFELVEKFLIGFQNWFLECRESLDSSSKQGLDMLRKYHKGFKTGFRLVEKFSIGFQNWVLTSRDSISKWVHNWVSTAEKVSMSVQNRVPTG
jgi:hypothetical protein